WSRLARTADEGLAPVLFDDPDQAIAELEEVASEVSRVAAGARASADSLQRARLSLRLELHLLHPAYATLLNLLDAFEEEAPKERRADHLDRFLIALRDYTRNDPDLELVAKAARQLWLRNRELLHAAQTDTLMGLYNYRGFWTAALPLASLAQRQRERVAVLMLDVDGLRAINDTLGHAAGDDVLRDVADALRDTLRDADVACRIGGDEFVALLVGVDDAGLQAVVKRLQDATAALSVSGRQVTVSIGVAGGLLEGDVTQGIEYFMRESERNMHAAKRERMAEGPACVSALGVC
ncbi:MAG TPA: GGDEF domain-containing protein, partial [Planctomycetota bacterium]|nr:GGDEF domain-containing protein [Planctomycetota bacterium]